MIRFLAGSLRKELLQRLVLRWGLLLEIVSTATLLLAFFLIDRFHVLLGPEALARLHTSYFGYVSLGLAVAGLANLGLSGVIGQMSSERSNRAFEYLMASPISIRRWAVAAGLCNLLPAFTQFAIIYGVASVILGLEVPRFDALAAIAVLAVASVPLWSLSVLTASVSLVSRRGDPLGFLLGMGFELLGGVYAPTDVLPKPLARLGELLPITPAVRAVQTIVYRGGGISGAIGDLGQLGALALVYLPAALVCLDAADRVSRRKGYYCLE